MKKILFVSAISAVFILSGCSGPKGIINRIRYVTNPETYADKTQYTACGVLPKMRVEEITGEKVFNAESREVFFGDDGFPGHSKCIYTLSDNRKIEFFYGTADLRRSRDKNIQEIITDGLKDETIDKSENIEDTGDSAFWASTEKGATGGNFGALYVFGSDITYLYLKMYRFQNESDAKEKAVKLAEDVVPKL